VKLTRICICPDAPDWIGTAHGGVFLFLFFFRKVSYAYPPRQIDVEYTTSMWSDAGIGVAGQHIIIKHFIDFLGYKFTIAEVLINQLAINSALPVIATVQYINRTLNYWYRDLVDLLTGQIANDLINRPSFLYM
jgi:hypothetical protein